MRLALPIRAYIYRSGVPLMPPDPPPHSRTLLWVIMAALAAWGALLALGAYLGLDPATPDRDYRRLLVVAATTGAFLAVWIGALYIHRRR